MKNAMNPNAFTANQTIGGRKAGPSQPPKNKTVIKEDIKTKPIYSATKNIPNFMPEYSV
tara:strand:+ start:328 stop:504 length:177 start_codon:yes stop_codon:yes gene_type:complete